MNGAAAPIRHTRFPAVTAVVDRIHHAYGGPLAVTDLARGASVSAGQLRRLFKRSLGMSPLKFLTRVRVQAACALLVDTDLPISQIASETGFCDQSHLNRHLVDIEGVTPRLYRRRNRP